MHVLRHTYTNCLLSDNNYSSLYYNTNYYISFPWLIFNCAAAGCKAIYSTKKYLNAKLLDCPCSRNHCFHATIIISTSGHVMKENTFCSCSSRQTTSTIHLDFSSGSSKKKKKSNASPHTNPAVFLIVDHSMSWIQLWDGVILLASCCEGF